MHAKEIKVLLLSRDLARTHAFYSIVGMAWGTDAKIGKSGLPEHVELQPELSSLPHLFGELGGTEFLFYLEKGMASMRPEVQTTFMVYLDTEEEAEKIVNKLKEAELFVAGRGFDRHFRRLIFDPDGRQIELCTDHPLRV